MTEDEIRGLLREMRETAVPADSLARVRLGLEQRMRQRARWKIAAYCLATAAVLLAALLLPWNLVSRKSEPLRNKIVAIAHQPETAVAELPNPAPKAKVRRAIRRVRQAEQNASPLVIRMETPDPDVLILLIGDKQN